MKGFEVFCNFLQIQDETSVSSVKSQQLLDIYLFRWCYFFLFRHCLYSFLRKPDLLGVHGFKSLYAKSCTKVKNRAHPRRAHTALRVGKLDREKFLGMSFAEIGYGEYVGFDVSKCRVQAGAVATVSPREILSRG